MAHPLANGGSGRSDAAIISNQHGRLSIDRYATGEAAAEQYKCREYPTCIDETADALTSGGGD